MCDETGWWHNRDVTNNFGSTWTRESVSCSGKRAGLLNWCISSTRWQSCTCDRLERCLVVKEVFWDIINTTTSDFTRKRNPQMLPEKRYKKCFLVQKRSEHEPGCTSDNFTGKKTLSQSSGVKWCRPGNEAAKSHDLSNGDVICWPLLHSCYY